MKVRRRDPVMEAEQWFPGKPVAGVIRVWICSCGMSFKAADRGPGGLCDFCGAPQSREVYLVDAGDDYHEMAPGEWVITAPEGRSVLAPEDFEQQYERIGG